VGEMLLFFKKNYLDILAAHVIMYRVFKKQYTQCNVKNILLALFTWDQYLVYTEG
jgi:hypothetical protein